MPSMREARRCAKPPFADGFDQLEVALAALERLRV
jgi:hypothetical protein